MALSRWDPFRDMTALKERMNKLFDESFARSRTPDEDSQMGSWSPPVDIYETDDKVILRADLPGVEQKDIDLRIEDNALILRGERKFERPERKEDFLRIERSYGAFQRAFRLPSSVDQGLVQASHKNGVLEVVLTKRDEVRPRAIKVEVK